MLKKIILEEAQCYLDDIFIPEKIKKLISCLSKIDKQTFYSYKPFRKRSISQFIVELTNNQWEVKNIELPQLTTFTQPADHFTDLRRLTRRFSPMDPMIVHSPELTVIIINIVKMLKECESQREIKKVAVTCHQISLILDNAEASVSNSPEGLHQDGSDYIISALVIDKYNIIGGTSELYCSEKKKSLNLTH